MAEILQFFKTIELWIYLILGIAGLFYLSRFVRAWNEMRQAAFGLEHESAQRRLNHAATGLVFLVLLAVLEFMLISFIIPLIPESSPLPTATLDILATATVTLAADVQTPTPALESSIFSEGLSGTEEPASADQSGCIPEQIFITEPQNDSAVSGLVPILGSAEAPNFGFYKFEFSSPGQPNWTAIQAWTQPRKNDTLGQWDTTRLSPGLYLLRLVVTDNQGKALAPCVIKVNIINTNPE